MCEDLKEKNIPLLDQVIEDNHIGDKKVKKRDLKKVFGYFKKDQTVVIGTRFDLNIYFRTFICALISYITFNGKYFLYVLTSKLYRTYR